MTNPVAATPPPESLLGELRAPVGDEVSRPLSRTENSKTPHEVGDEVRKLVHRFGQTDERIRALLIETPHPGGDGERAQQENTSGLGESPTPCGAKFEDRQPVSGWIMGPSMGFDLLHTSILDANLLTKDLDLVLKPVLFSPLSKLRVQALRSPTLGQCQGGPGKGDDLDDRRADAPGPASGKWKGCRQGNWGHGAVSRKCARLKRWETAYPLY